MGEEILEMLSKAVAFTVIGYCKILKKFSRHIQLKYRMWLNFLETWFQNERQAADTNYFVVASCLVRQHCIQCGRFHACTLVCIYWVASCHIVVSYVGEHLVPKIKTNFPIGWIRGKYITIHRMEGWLGYF